jgi:hypothetical protein
MYNIFSNKIIELGTVLVLEESLPYQPMAMQRFDLAALELWVMRLGVELSEKARAVVNAAASAYLFPLNWI